MCTPEKTKQKIDIAMSLPTDGTMGLLRLRLAVGVLGEKNGWWETNALNPEFRSVVKGLFPRSWRLAAMNATAEAAKIVHEKAVKRRSQHLFRFHTELEQDLRRMVFEAERVPAIAKTFDASVSHPEETLRELAEKGGRLHEGAVSLGEPSREFVLAQVPRMAALYLAAFLNGTQCYPFFEPEVK